MLIGVLSDTHDHLPNGAAAVRALLDRGATMLIHCGDICSPDMLELLAGVPAAFVYGNGDWDRAGLARRAQSLGITALGAMGELELEGKRIAIAHGDDAPLVASLLRQQRHDYLLQGHTHVRMDRQVGRMRHINPGALQRASVKSAALLDVAAGTLESIEIPPQ